MKKIDLTTAGKIQDAYKKKMKELGVDTPQKGFTHTVSFPVKDLKEWLNSLNGKCDHIKIHFGMYPKQHHKSPKTEKTDDRFTVLLWPCNAKGEPARDDEGNPELPVNAGKLEP